MQSTVSPRLPAFAITLAVPRTVGVIALAGLLACAAFPALAEPPAEGHPTVGRAHAVEAWLEQAARDTGFAGAVLLAEDGRVTLARGYGLADRDAGRPNTAATAFDLGSIAKQLTKAAVLRLEQEGGLSLDDTLGDLLAAERSVPVPAEKATVTVRQLLTHQAGLQDFHDTEGDFEPMGRDEALRRILAAPLRFPPGTDQAYSNSGYTLLAILLELRSGTTYEEYLERHVLRPAGMDRTGFPGDARWGAKVEGDGPLPVPVAVGYGGRRVDEDAPAEANSPAGWPTLTWALKGNGGLVAPLGDLHRYTRALRDGRILEPQALERYFTLDGPGAADAPFAYAGGNDFGFFAVAIENPRDGVHLYFASNAADGDPRAALRGVQRILAGAEPGAPPETSRDGEPELPDSHRGRAAAAFLAALHGNDDDVARFFRDSIHPDLRKQRDLAFFQGMFRRLRQDVPEPEVTSLAPLGDNAVELVLTSRGTGDRLRVVLELAGGEPPELLRGLKVTM